MVIAVLVKTLGFTLIELVMITSLVAVAVTFSVYSYQDIMLRLSIQLGFYELLQIAAQIERQYLKTGSYRNLNQQLKTIICGSKLPLYAVLPGPATTAQKYSLIAIPLYSSTPAAAVICLNHEGKLFTHASVDCADPAFQIPHNPCQFSQGINNNCQGECKERVICGSCFGNCQWSYIDGDCNGNCQHSIITHSCFGECANSQQAQQLRWINSRR